MRVALLALCLVGCGKDGGKDGRPTAQDSTPPTTPTVGTPVTTTPTVRPLLESPAEAVDLDPAADVVEIALTAAPHTIDLGDQQISGWAYNDQVPGPTIRATLGDTLVVTLTNDLPDPTTIHWHGMHVPWAMDGVTWMQTPVAPGATFEYRFTLTQSGTFWYHPHFDTERQVDLGLYGVLIVEDPAEPTVDADEVWVFDAWAEHEAATDGSGEHTHGPDATPRFWTVNSLRGPQWEPPTGSVARVRILNASNTGYLDLTDVRVIAEDQGLLAAVRDGEVLLGPGDRAELEWTADSAMVLASLPHATAGPAWGDPIELLAIEPSGPDVASAAPSWPFSGTAAAADPGWTDVIWVLQGDGETASWMINGEQFPNVTIPQIQIGADAIVEIRNLSAAEHPFHLHGMSMEMLSIDGVAPAFRTVEDTWNVPVGGIVRMRVHPETAGDWMAHCHILPHATLGMMTVLRAQ